MKKIHINKKDDDHNEKNDLSDDVIPDGTEAKGDCDKNEKDESSVSIVNDIED